MTLQGLSTVALAKRPPSPRFKVDSGRSRLLYGDRISSYGASASRIRTKSIRCAGLGESRQGSLGNNNSVVYEGIYGPWTIESSDVREVILYRSGLVTAATSFVIAASAAFFPDSSSLSAIKRILQTLWVLGVIGSATVYINFAQPANESLTQYVLENPSAVWLVGPLFAAMTGLVFKEGLCYGKLEAGVLTFVIPILLLGHLFGLMDDGPKLFLLASWMTLFVIFAGRKFTQPIKDDIGDKSVFMFNSLEQDEKETLLEKLQQGKTQ
ncbi:uncharacterized protein [Arachis hypogaea]|uniref:uncharacterized protein isoform X2 n=1 Tax=Arachis hypogaea TaxID=3818 RepID=UPI000DEC65C7|nr:uncharacterized protein LOC112706171 isoform X2 [Arachis hypogaea]